MTILLKTVCLSYPFYPKRLEINMENKKTFNEWSELGYKIKKGSKGTKINGKFFFSSDQVERTSYKSGMSPPYGGREAGYDIWEAHDLDNPLEENHYGQW